MYSSQSPSPKRERDVIPLAPKERPTVEDAWSGGPPRDLDASSDQRMRKRRKDIWSPRPSGVRSDLVEGARPPLGRRISRSVGRFFIAVLIGVGATLGWQSHGDEAKAMVRTYAPSLAWLLPDSTTQPSAAAAAATSAELAQQLEPVVRDVAVVRRSVEELAARQEQMAQTIAALQAIEEDIRQKMSSPPPSATPVAPKPPLRTTQQPSAAQPPSVSAPPPAAARPPLVLR